MVAGNKKTKQNVANIFGFLLWLQDRERRGLISFEVKQDVGYLVFEYLREQTIDGEFVDVDSIEKKIEEAESEVMVNEDGE